MGDDASVPVPSPAYTVVARCFRAIHRRPTVTATGIDARTNTASWASGTLPSEPLETTVIATDERDEEVSQIRKERPARGELGRRNDERGRVPQRPDQLQEDGRYSKGLTAAADDEADGDSFDWE